MNLKGRARKPGRLPWILRCALLLAGSALAAEPAPVVRVGCELAFRPYSFVDSNGRATGLAPELLKAVAKEMGLQVEITTGPWDHIWDGLLAGEFDVLPLVAKTPDRLKLVDFTARHTETFDAFFVQKGKPMLENLNAAAGKEIVVMRFDAAHDELLARNFQGKLILVETIPEGLALIAAGHHDALLGPKMIGMVEMREHGISGVIASPPIPDYVRKFAFAVRKGNPELLNKLSEGLLIIKTNGEYDRIYREWLRAHDPWLRVRRSLWPALGIAGLLGAVVVGLFFALERLVRQRTRELAQANQEIAKEVAERRKAESTLQQWNQTLEKRIAERTDELAKAAAELEATNRSLRDSQRGALNLLEDAVAAREQAERASGELRESEQGLRLQRDRMPIGCIVHDDKGCITQVNPSAERILGYSEAELKGLHASHLVPESARPGLEDILRRLMEGDMTAHSINENRTKDGRIIVCEWTNTPLRDRKGAFTGFLSMVQDITERKHAEEALRQSEELFRVIFTESRVGKAQIDPFSNRFVQVNAAFQGITGYSEAELAERSILDLTHPDDRAAASSQFDTLSQREQGGYQSETRFVRPDGAIVWVNVSMNRVHDSSGRPLRSIAVVQDITERKKAEQALLDTQEMLRADARRLSLVLDTQRAIAAADGDYPALLQRILESTARITGADGASLEVADGDEIVYEAATGIAAPFVGLRLPLQRSLSGICMTTGKLMRSDDSEADPRVNREACRKIGLRSMLLIPLRYDEHSFGVLKIMSARVAAFDDGAEHMQQLMTEFLGVTIARKRMEEALRQSRADLDRAQEVGQIGSWRLDIRRNVLTWSDENHRIFGIPKGTPLSYETFLGTIHPDDRPQVDQAWQEALRGKPYDIEHRLLLADGQVKWVREKAYLECDRTGALLGGFGITQDITQRRAGEEAFRWNARRSELLSQTATRLLESSDPQRLVEDLCRQVMDLLDCEYFFNFLVDREVGDRLNLNACAGIPVDQIEGLRTLDFGVAVCGCVARDGERIIAEHIADRSDPQTELIKGFGVQAYCCHPLRVQDQLLGTLSFGTRSRPSFKPEQVEVMHAVTDLVALAIYRVRIEEDLRSSEEKFRLLVEQTPDGIFVSDPHGNYSDVNQAGCQLLGYSREEILQKNIADVVAQDELPRIAPEIARLAHESVVIGHWRFRRKDGSFFIGEVVARQLPDGRLQAILRDITERKKAENAIKDSLQEKEVLLKEIHHRVKNNMQVISSLASFQARELQTSDEAVIAAFQDMAHRVRSMAMVHERLYESPDLARIEFASYARGLLDYLIRSYRKPGREIRLRCEMPSFYLPVDTAVPCGLILNELAVNALKHAFNGRERGMLTVCLQQATEGHRITLSVQDDGVGLPQGFDWQSSKSLGLRLVQMLSRQLHATIHARVDSGTAFTMELPLPEGRN